MINDFKKMLRFDEEVVDYASEVAENIRKNDRPFILFGAGITGEKVYNYLKGFGLKPLCFCDNNPLKQGTKIEEIDVYSLAQIKESYNDFIFVVSCDAFLEISRQLVSEGFDEKDIYYIEPDWLNSPSGQGEFIRDHLSEFEEAYNLMYDDKSRRVFTGILNYRITHSLKYVEGLPDVIPYFDRDLIQMHENEVFFDCGAFIGDTLNDFIRITEGKYKRVICFEPNIDNVTLLKKTISEKSYENVDVFPCGLSDKKQTLHFSGSSENGRIKKYGEITIECDTIDNLCYDSVDKVTFIKMDIEGSEFYALKGAERIIKRDHPKLAICVYHRMDDFYTLTKCIKEIYSGYKLYFRQYELSGEETVCFALPK